MQTRTEAAESLVDSQRTALYTLVDRRTDISNILRGYLTNTTVDTNAVVNLSAIYGALDGEISYYYAANFSKVGWTLTNVQRDTLTKIRNLDKYPCVGAYLYSDSIGVPAIANTDHFFKTGSINYSKSNATFGLRVYPNPFNTSSRINFNLPQFAIMDIRIFDVSGRLITVLAQNTLLDAGQHSIFRDVTGMNGSRIGNGIYVCKLMSDGKISTAKIIYAQ